MRVHSEEIILPHTPEQLYALVADVEKYPEFIPWCKAARVYDPEEGAFKAELVVGFKGVTERYTSKVHLKNHEVDIEYIRGPFSVLENNWKFTAEGNGTKINFFIKFQFRSAILQALIGGLFEKAVHKMVAAFTQRAEKLYGKS